MKEDLPVLYQVVFYPPLFAGQSSERTTLLLGWGYFSGTFSSTDLEKDHGYEI